MLGRAFPATETQVKDGILNNVVLLGEFIAVCGEQGPRGVVQDTEEIDVVFRFLDFVIKLLAVVADTDQLDQDAFGQDDDGAHEQCEEHRLHRLNPRFVLCLWLESYEQGKRGLIDNHPEDEGNRLLHRPQKESVFLDTRAHDANEELKDLGQEMSDDLHGPETQPDDLNPDPEQLLVGAADAAGNGTCLREDDGNGQKKSHRGNIDHVARDDAVVEDLGVDSAHTVEGRLLLLASARRQLPARPGVDLGQLSASAVKHARLLCLLLLVRGRRMRRRVADHRLQGNVGSPVVHVVASTGQRLEAVVGKAKRPRGG